MKNKLGLTLFVLISIFSLCLVGCNETKSIKLESDNGIIVEGSLQDGSKLIANKIGATDTQGFLVAELIKDLDYDKFSPIYIHEIFVVKDEERVQPEDKVTITLPLPTTLSDCIIIHIKSDNSKEILTPTIQDGKAIFEVDSFSYFIIASKK